MSSNYLEYILEILDPYGDISYKSMFGGYSIYKNGIIIAIIADEELYFKVDESNIEKYQKMDSESFKYEKNGKIFSMSYWKVPIEILENDQILGEWVDDSYKISQKIKNKKQKIKNK